MKRCMRMIALLLTAALLLSGAALAADGAAQAGPPRAPRWTIRDVSIRSGEDVLAASLTLPGNADADSGDALPLVILIHGLSSDRAWVADCAWALADAGIASIAVDMAGFGRSTGATEDMTVTSLVQNVQDVLDYVRALPFVDADHIFLLGKSMGGVASALTAVDRLDQIAGVILWNPAFNITSAVRDGDFLGVPFDPENIPDTVTWFLHKYGRAFIEECRDIDTDQLLERLTCPVLMLSGNRDTIVPLLSSMYAAEHLSNCDFHVIKGGYHCFLGQQEEQALSLTVSWVQQQLS